MRVAALDCGTNSIRLLVADLLDQDVPVDGALVDGALVDGALVDGALVDGALVDGALVDGALSPRKVDIHREMRIVRLGQDVDRTGMLATEALERTRVALVDYAATCRELGVEQIRMVATSATRDASNQAEFSAMVESVLGVLPEVITGAEEAELSFVGATGELDPADGPFLVIDIGGGSTEFVLGTGTVEASISINLGCVRLTERHLLSDPPTAAQVQAARVDVEAALALVCAEVPIEQARTVVGLAGSVTTIAGVALRLPSYDPTKIHLSRLSGDEIRAVSVDLLAMSRQRRADLPVMHPGRVDVIGGGALVLQMTMDRFGLDHVVVSE